MVILMENLMRHSVTIWSKFDQNQVKTRSKSSQNYVKILSKIRSKFGQNTVKIRLKSGQNPLLMSTWFMNVPQRICGRKFVTANEAMMSKTVCSSRSPFNLRFISDHWDFTGMMAEANNPGAGARLAYQLVSCGAK